MPFRVHLRSPRALVLAVLLGVLGLAQVARADLVAPNVSTCRDKEVGTSCVLDDGTDGRCQTSSCSHRVLAPPSPVVPGADGGATMADTSPHFVFAEYACNVCTPKGAWLTADAAAAPVTPPSPPPSRGGCSVGSDGSAAGSLSPVFVVAGFFFLSARSRRARRAVRGLS